MWTVLLTFKYYILLEILCQYWSLIQLTIGIVSVNWFQTSAQVEDIFVTCPLGCKAAPAALLRRVKHLYLPVALLRRVKHLYLPVALLRGVKHL